MTPLPAGLLDGLLDDAAVFPPGSLPLGEAVSAHLTHLRSPYAALVGPLVVAAQDLAMLAQQVDGLSPRSLRVSVTSPMGCVRDALECAAGIAAVQVAAVEVAPPPGAAGESVARLHTLVGAGEVQVYVEVPRDERRDEVVSALVGTRFRAKLRTGGVVADLHPGADELAAAVAALVAAGIPFKATAGLHHAVRNTDPATGFEQHGFLNLMLATDAARRGDSVHAVAALLEERDASRIAARVRTLGRDVRSSFLSFGTCSVREPVEDLLDLGLLPAAVAR